MKTYPEIPRVENAPDDLFEQGHLWIQELIDGAHFRFQLLDSGIIRFGDRNRVYDPADVPMAYQHAVRHVREHLDREALRTAVDDAESVVFFGEATQHRVIEYDWGRTPSFLGFDVWSVDRERFLPPDTVQQIFDRLGLHSINVFQQEIRAAHFDPDSYEIPTSNWYDGPAAGVLLRNKTGLRAKLCRPEIENVDEVEPIQAEADDLARTYATRRRLERVAHELSDAGKPVTFEAMYERTLEAIVREEHRRLFHGASEVDMGAFRSEVSGLVRQFVTNR